MCTAQWRQEDGVARGLEAPPLNVQDDRSDVLWSLRGLGRLLLWLLLRLLRLLRAAAAVAAAALGARRTQ